MKDYTNKFNLPDGLKDVFGKTIAKMELMPDRQDVLIVTFTDGTIISFILCNEHCTVSLWRI